MDGSKNGRGKYVSKAISDWLTSIEAASPGTVDAANDPSWVLAHMPPVELFPFDPTHRALRCSRRSCCSRCGYWHSWRYSHSSRYRRRPRRRFSGRAHSRGRWGLFLRTSESRAKRDSLRRYKQRHAEVSTAERAASKAERDRRAVDQRERQALEKIGKRANDARTSEQKELQGAETRFACDLSKLGTRALPSVGRIRREGERTPGTTRPAPCGSAQYRLHSVGHDLRHWPGP